MVTECSNHDVIIKWGKAITAGTAKSKPTFVGPQPRYDGSHSADRGLGWGMESDGGLRLGWH